MAGLLDQPSGGLLDWIGTPAGQGLLTAVAAGMAGARRGAPINSIGAGMLGGLQGYANAQDQQMQAKRYDQQNKLFDAQMQNIQAQADAKKAAQEQAKLQQGYLSTVGRVTSPVIGAEPNKFDPMKWLSLGGSVEDAKALSSSGNWGKSAIKDYKEVRNPDGSVSIVGFDEFGNQINTGATPFKDAKIQDFGGYLGAIDPVSLKTTRLGNKSMTPGEAASNSVAWFNARTSSDRLAFDKQNQTKPEYKDGQWVTPPRDMKPGEVRTITGGQQTKDANDALALIGQARDILPNATGSYAGAGYDQAMRFFGKSTDGALAGAKLKAIGGALVSKMPKMSGPQSDKDVAMYREMAGRVGDETLPISERSAALDAVEEIQSRYASGQGGAPVPRPSPVKNPTGLQFLGFE